MRVQRELGFYPVWWLLLRLGMWREPKGLRVQFWTRAVSSVRGTVGSWGSEAALLSWFWKAGWRWQPPRLEAGPGPRLAVPPRVCACVSGQRWPLALDRTMSEREPGADLGSPGWSRPAGRLEHKAIFSLLPMPWNWSQASCTCALKTLFFLQCSDFKSHTAIQTAKGAYLSDVRLQGWGTWYVAWSTVSLGKTLEPMIVPSLSGSPAGDSEPN